MYEGLEQISHGQVLQIWGSHLSNTRLIYYGVETIYFVVFVVKSALKVIPSIIIFTR